MEVIEINGIEYEVKRCKRCHKIKQLDKFSIKNDMHDNHASWCKDCHRRYYLKRKKEKKKKQEDEMKMNKKKCSKCKQVKQVSEFHKNRRNKDCLQPYCKDCQKKYYQTPKGKESHRKACKKYKQAHQEEYNKYQKQWYMQHQISKRKDSAKRRGLGFNLITPPDEFYEDDWFSFELVFHHINNTDVVLIPKELHEQYKGYKNHKAKLLPIIKKHYSDLV